MVGMSDRHGQGVRSVGAADLHAREEPLHHRMDLCLFSTAHSDHSLLDQARRIFADFQPASRGSEKNHAARLTKLEAGLWIIVQKHFFDGCSGGLIVFDHLAESLIKPKKPARNGLFGVRAYLAVGYMTETIALRSDHAPTGATKPGVEADDDQANRSRTASGTS
jgi:hypothetical protein